MQAADSSGFLFLRDYGPNKHKRKLKADELNACRLKAKRLTAESVETAENEIIATRPTCEADSPIRADTLWAYIVLKSIALSPLIPLRSQRSRCRTHDLLHCRIEYLKKDIDLN